MRKSQLAIGSFYGYVAMVTAVVGRTKTESEESCACSSLLDWITENSMKDIDANHISRHDTHEARTCAVDDHLYSTILHWPLPSKQLLADRFLIDPETKNYVRKVKNALFSRTNTTPFEGSVTLVAWTEDVLIDLLDLNPVVTKTPEFVGVFSGNVPLMKSPPLTHRYGGHQFGFWAGQLGDGRAHMIGEYMNHKGERWEMQLKGSGKSPYSRQGDGRAILRSSVREFLASEAMHHLGKCVGKFLALWPGFLFTPEIMAFLHPDVQGIQTFRRDRRLK